MAIRSLVTLQDCIRAIKEIDEQLTNTRTRDIDMHKRRIKNASPSQDDYDYVVRKELRDGIEENTTLNFTGGSSVSAEGFYLRTFGYGVNRNLTTGTNLLPDLIIPFPSTTLVKIYAKVKVAPTGATAIADINLLGTSILDGSKITIPISSTAVVEIDTFTTTNFTEGQVLTFDMDQIGSTIPGQTLVVTMKFKIN